MSTDARDEQPRISALLDAIAEAIANTPDDEIVEDVAAAGENADEIAREAAAAIETALHEVKVQRRSDAMQRRSERLRRLNEQAGHRRPRIPGTPAEQRMLLQRILSREKAATVQWRDYESMSDDEVQSTLNQMEALGLITEEDVESE